MAAYEGMIRALMFKRAVIALGEVAVLVGTIWLVIGGKFLYAAALFFLGGALVYFLLDMLTGVLLLPALLPHLLRPRKRGQFGGDDHAGTAYMDRLLAIGRETIIERANALTALDVPPIGKDVELAIRRYAAHAPAQTRLLYMTCAANGYLWRRAHHDYAPSEFSVIRNAVERDARRGCQLAEVTLADEHLTELAGYWSLYCAARIRAGSEVPAAHGSLGGERGGAETIRQAFAEMTDYLPPDATTPEARRAAAFDFGVNIADVEHVLNADAQPT